ncbi:hypothetical protein [Rhodococcus tibetensis]|uniref:PEP-CTERM protein-sorting domain-containing protein n=1 Tax=Rhodococcus tibetensis TaxID=2965064 RepID=A0ABT1QJA7_9NOCA|nr:hypothetical protein [Rhodococcus sp. FXJ9.536]MCQ4121875.1 hypothetical protein [Rhodococcus sp. FXJ9.536]
MDRITHPSPDGSTVTRAPANGGSVYFSITLPTPAQLYVLVAVSFGLAALAVSRLRVERTEATTTTTTEPSLTTH